MKYYSCMDETTGCGGKDCMELGHYQWSWRKRVEQSPSDKEHRADLVGRTPMIGRPRDTPWTNTNGRTPTIGQRLDAPWINANGRTPTIGQSLDAPWLNTNGRTPTIGQRLDAPWINTDGRTPTIGQRLDAPWINTNGRTPTIGQSLDAPWINTDGRTPTIERYRDTEPVTSRSQPDEQDSGNVEILHCIKVSGSHLQHQIFTLYKYTSM